MTHQDDVADAFADAVAARLHGTPYEVVDRRPDGFEVRVDLADARWWGLLSRSSLRSVFSHLVRLDARGGYAVTDRAWNVAWTAGVDGTMRPRATASASMQLGTVRTVSFRKTYGVSDAGRVEPVVDYALDTEQGRAALRDAASELGLRARMSTATKIGVGFGIGGGVVALLAVGVALVVSLTA